MTALDRLDPVSLDEMDSIRLMNRVDSKYVTTESVLAKILERCEGSFRVLCTVSGRTNTYDTVYFDTPGLDMYFEHHNRRLDREKIRVRRYCDSGECFIEIKHKNNHGRTKKKRRSIDPELFPVCGNSGSGWCRAFRTGPAGGCGGAEGEPASGCGDSAGRHGIGDLESKAGGVCGKTDGGRCGGDSGKPAGGCGGTSNGPGAVTYADAPICRNAGICDYVRERSRYRLEETSPAIRSRFVRITLVDNDLSERITIDRELGFDNLRTGLQHGMKDAVIIEVKQDGAARSKMKDILSDLRVKPLRLSKYCVGTVLTAPGIKKSRFKERIRAVEKLTGNKLLDDDIATA